jgi:hypothetical protein
VSSAGSAEHRPAAGRFSEQTPEVGREPGTGLKPEPDTVVRPVRQGLAHRSGPAEESERQGCLAVNYPPPDLERSGLVRPGSDRYSEWSLFVFFLYSLL